MNTVRPSKPVAIVGGGVTGLTAAFRLTQQGIPVKLYEATQRTGGVIKTCRHEGYLAEFGPNSILETSPRIGSLIHDLGLENRRLYSDPAAEARYVVRDHKPVPLPNGFAAFMRTPLFSTAAKLRLLAEPFIPPAPPEIDESLGDFVVRRIGREFLDYAINPFVAGVYAGDPFHLSVRHAFPKLHALEQRYRSLILGQFLGARERRRRKEVSKQNAKKLSFDEGLQVLTGTLEERLGDCVQLDTSVVRVQQAANGWTVTTSRHGTEEEHDHSAVLFAAPAFTLPGIQIVSKPPLDWSFFARVQYPPVASVVLGFRREDVAHPLDGFGMLVPEIEGLQILGTIFSSSLFPNRAPTGHVTLTTYIGGTRAPHLAQQEPDELVNIALRDLKILLGVSGRPTFKHPVQFAKAIPQYETGYGKIKAAMDHIEANAPGLFIAGPHRSGIALSDCIVAGEESSERIAKLWTDSPPNGQTSDVPKPTATLVS